MAPRPESLVLYAAAALLASSVTVAWAQAPKASGPKIYCWKNAKGQTECGDQPPANAPGDVTEAPDATTAATSITDGSASG